MRCLVISVLCKIIVLKLVHSLIPTSPPYYPTSATLEPGDYGEALYLTPFLEAGDTLNARERSRVGKLPNVPSDIESYSGYITSNSNYSSNVFFWYFRAMENTSSAETVIWFQGGPGWTSLYGVFMESGPYKIYNNYNVSMRQNTWTRLFNMIYVDIPVGTGFSFTENKDGHATSSKAIANELYTVVLQLFQIYPELQKTDFYVAGESIGGQYVVDLSLKLHENKPENIKFVGLFAGNPVLSFEHENTGDLLYTIGLANENQRLHFIEKGRQYRHLLSEGRKVEALELRTELLFGSSKVKQTYFMNITGFQTNTNFLYSLDIANIFTFEDYLGLPQVRRALHVSNNTFHAGSRVSSYLGVSMLIPVVESLAKLMNDYKVMLYYGQTDMLMTYIESLELIKYKMKNWKNYKKYSNAHRDIWRVDPDDVDVAGYSTKVDQFYHVLIRDAGHMAPYYKPRAAFDAVRRFIKDIPF